MPPSKVQINQLSKHTKTLAFFMSKYWKIDFYFWCLKCQGKNVTKIKNYLISKHWFTFCIALSFSFFISSFCFFVQCAVLNFWPPKINYRACYDKAVTRTRARVHNFQTLPRVANCKRLASEKEVVYEFKCM